MKLSGRSNFHRPHPARLICVLVAILVPTTVAAQNIDPRAGGSGPTARQSVPDQPRASTTPFSSRAAMKERVNANTIGVIAGGIDGTEIRIAADLAAVLDDADAGGGGLHILPALGDGSVRNLNDLMYLQDTDIGIVQSDVLAYAQRDRQQSNLNEQLRYITQLYAEDFPLLAGRGIRSVEALAGRKVNIDAPGSGTAITASLVFNLLKIGIEPVHFD